MVTNTGGGVNLRVNTWPLQPRRRPLEHRFRARQTKHGDLVVIPRAELERLVQRAETNTRQLELQFDLREGGAPT